MRGVDYYHWVGSACVVIGFYFSWSTGTFEFDPFTWGFISFCLGEIRLHRQRMEKS